jgi:hypothetical protein
MTYNDLIQAHSTTNVAEIMVEAFGRLFMAADSVYLISRKAAFILLVIALVVTAWRGRTAQDVAIWLWTLLALIFATITIAQWLDITRPPDGAAWQFGQAFAKVVGNANSTTLDQFLDRVMDGFPEPSWTDVILYFKVIATSLCTVLSQIVIFLMRLFQMAMIAVLYSLGPIFIAFICLNVLRSPGVRYMFTMFSMYTWELAWKFVDIGSEALASFGSTSGDGYNPGMIVLALIWAILAPIFMPIFLSRLFVSGASGIAETAQGFAMGRMSASVGAIAKNPTGTLASLGRVAAAATGVGAVASVGQAAFSAMKSAAGKVMSTAKQAATNGNKGTNGDAVAPTSGPLQSGQSMKVTDPDGKSAIASIKRNDANNFSIGKQNFKGDPNKPETLFNALAQTHLNHADQATVRHAMSSRQQTA